jgi:hypothetical protein
MEIITKTKDNLGFERNFFQEVKYTPPKTKITNARQLAIKPFVVAINKERPCTYVDKKGKKKKLGFITARAVSLKVSHLEIPDLEYFYSQCVDYKNRKGSFSKYFFGALNPKATKQQ